MATIREMRNRFKALKKSLNDISQNALYETERHYLDYIREQMMRGEDKFGRKIGEYRSEDYADIKHEMNPLAGYGFVDLRKEGDFYEQLELFQNRTKEILIQSKDRKNDILLREYGNDVLGLQEDSRKSYVKRYFRPIFIRDVELFLFSK